MITCTGLRRLVLGSGYVVAAVCAAVTTNQVLTRGVFSWWWATAAVTATAATYGLQRRMGAADPRQVLRTRDRHGDAPRMNEIKPIQLGVLDSDYPQVRLARDADSDADLQAGEPEAGDHRWTAAGGCKQRGVPGGRRGLAPPPGADFRRPHRQGSHWWLPVGVLVRAAGRHQRPVAGAPHQFRTVIPGHGGRTLLHPRPGEHHRHHRRHRLAPHAARAGEKPVARGAAPGGGSANRSGRGGAAQRSTAGRGDPGPGRRGAAPGATGRGPRPRPRHPDRPRPPRRAGRAAEAVHRLGSARRSVHR